MRSLVLGVALALAAGAGTRAAESSPGRVVKITAKKFEYSPSEIHLRRGERVVLELTSLDRKHGFKLPELGIRADVPAGATARIEVLAERPGRLVTSIGVACVSPSQHPHALSLGSSRSLIGHLRAPAETGLGPGSSDRCRTAHFPSVPGGAALAPARLLRDCPIAETA